MLRTRVITAVILAIVLLGAMFFLPELGWRLFTLAVSLVALWEWSRVARFSAIVQQTFLGASALAGLILLYLLSSGDESIARVGRDASTVAFAAASLFWIVLGPLWLKFGWRPQGTLVLALTGWVVIIPTWFALMLHREVSPWYLLGLMALVWVADIAAYFAGHAFGRHKLAPGISPGKTWEGVAGAVAGVLVYSVLCAWLLQRFSAGRVTINVQSLPALATAFVLLTALSIVGDLFESWMKRGAGLKDSSNLLPGHGGVLDRIDALTSTLPVAPLILLLVARWFNA